MIRRMYHVSCVTCSMKKQGLKLNKMLNPKANKPWFPNQSFNAESLPSLKSLTKVQRVPGKQGVRRIAMLNKLFMKNITDLMSNGTVSMDVVGRGIEISKVKVTPDLQTVNVFWVCKGDISDEETEAILQNIAGALRHELSTLRLMGEVPYIEFLKDKQETHLVELDRRLARADYGEDYTPTEMGHLLKSEFTLDTKLSPEMKAKIKQLEDAIEIIDEPLPEMTHTVFGLDHEKIMNRLLAARKRSKDAWSHVADSPVITYRAPAEASPDVDPGNQRQELAEFLLKRQILQNKLHKQMWDSRQEWRLTHEDQEDGDEEPFYDGDEYEEYEEETYNDEVYNHQSSVDNVINEQNRDKR